MPEKSINDWYEIFKNMKLLPPLKPPVVFDKKVICFIADGGYSEWNGNTIDKGIGGSEKYIIMMAKYMKKNSDCIILVFCNTPTIVECDGVKYIPLNNIYTSLTVHYIDICIISRYSQYLPVAMNSYADKIYAVVHDVTLSGEIIIDSPKLKNIICLTEWHKNYFLEKHPEMKDKTIIIGNGIENFTKTSTIPINKQPFKFIYTSAANRGLILLLQMWNNILEIHPTAELHCYTDIDNKYINITDKDMMDNIRKLLPMKNVYMHGWADRETLERAWSTSSIWLYPCIFKETFCISALEAAISRTLVITNNLAGLNETVGNRGTIVSGSANTASWMNQVYEILKNINNNTYDYLLESNYNYAMNNTWEIKAKEMLKLFDLENNDARNTFQWAAILMNNSN